MQPTSTTMTRSPAEVARPRPRRRRRPLVWAMAAVAVAAAVFVLVWFQPQKLFIDETVDEAFPELDRTAASAEATGAETAAMSTPTTAAPSPAVTATAPTGTATTASPAETTLPSGPVLRSQGAFTSLAHGTSGSALIVAQPDGSLVLRLENLDTDNGPDLRVLLSPAAGGEEDYETGAVELGALKGNKGNQNYDIPAGTDLSAIGSVVIWCERFSVAFGSAELAGA